MLNKLSLFYQIYLSFLAALLGLVMGSALNCLAFRIVRGEKWSGGRSKCPRCGHVLGAAELVPLFSWLFLRGKCRWCRAPISPRYPITEALLSLVYVLTLRRFGLSADTAVYLILFSCLFCLSLVDIDTQIIPDRFLLIPAALRLLQLALGGGLGRALSCALALGGGVLVLSLIMDRVLKKESMGGGDIKLLFVLGLYFSLPCCLFLLIASCIVGIAVAALTVRAEKAAFPFGPAISLAAFLTAMVGERVTAWYMGLF